MLFDLYMYQIANGINFRDIQVPLDAISFPLFFADPHGVGVIPPWRPPMTCRKSRR